MNYFYFAVLIAAIYISYFDLKTKTIPDKFNAALLGFVFLATPLVAKDLESFFKAWLVGAAVFVAFYFLAVVSHGAFGGGDIKFAPSLSVALAMSELRLAGYGIFVAFQIAALVALVLLIIKKRSLRQTIAFGPYLTLGFATVWVTNLVVA